MSSGWPILRADQSFSHTRSLMRIGLCLLQHPLESETPLGGKGLSYRYS